MRNRYTNLGWFITILIAITPVALWLLAAPVPWNTTKNVFENLGKLAGLAGMALFAWNVILSARLKIYNKLFMGLDNTYRAHHIIGSSAFILLLMHPVFITYRYFLSSPISAFEFVKPGLESPFKTLGTLTLVGMILAMVITLYLNVKYERFVLAQRVLGLLLFIGGIHAVFVGGTDLRGGVGSLSIYFFVLILVSAMVYVYRSIMHGNFSKYYNYTVSEVIHMGDVYELVLTTNDAPMKYLPGQFAFIKFEADGILGQTHPFSMSSDPSGKTLRFGIKTLGDYTELLAKVEKGQRVKVDGPYGTFSNKIVKNHRQVWIAGGIGITPFMAMARSLDDSQKVDLYYSTKTAKEAVYLDELKSIASKKPNLRIIPFDAEKQGFMTIDYVFKNSEKLDDANFMICGPGGMMKAMRAQLKANGVSKKNINTEEFNLA